MAEVKPSDLSGTAPVIGPAVLVGKRRKFYLQDEDLAVISRDKFDMLESAIGDRGLFSHLAVGFLGASLPLFVEMWIAWRNTGDETSGLTALVAVAAAVLGVFFGIFVWVKNSRVKQVRASLFADQNLVDDRTILNTEDGGAIQIVHLSQSASDAPQSHPNTET